jgi:hypothetical protein
MKKVFLLLTTSALLYFSCSQKDTGLQSVLFKTPANDIVAMESNADNLVEAADYEADLFSLGEASLTNYSGLKSATMGMGGSYQNMFQNMFMNMQYFRFRYMNGVCPNVNLTTTNGGFPKTLTVDYGTGIQLANGRTLSGKITIVISGPASATGSTRSITYTDFSNGRITLSGTSTKTRMQDSIKKEFSTESNMTLTFKDSTTLTRSEKKVMTWLAGAKTEFNPADDSIQITGNIKVKNRKGDEYSKTITNPQIKTGECRYITRGTVEFKSGAVTFATLDYGNGECDDKATRTTKDGTKEILLGQ